MSKYRYYLLKANSNKGDIVKANGRNQYIYENKDWVRTGIMLEYFWEDDPKYEMYEDCLLYTSPSPRDRTRSRMPSSA